MSTAHVTSADRARTVIDALRQIAEAEKRLRGIGVVRSAKEITTELGEWLAAEVFGWTQAATTTQKGWDVKAGDGKRIQVRTERKDKDNVYRDSFFVSDTDLKNADLFALISFNRDRRVRHLYLVAGDDVPSLGRRINDKRNQGWELRRSKLEAKEVLIGDSRLKEPDLFRQLHADGGSPPRIAS